MVFDWVMGCGLGWFVGPKFLLCDELGWVGSVVWWVGLDSVQETGPTDNSALATSLTYLHVRTPTQPKEPCLVSLPCVDVSYYGS